MSDPIIKDTLRTRDNDGNVVIVYPKTIDSQIENIGKYIKNVEYNLDTNKLKYHAGNIPSDSAAKTEILLVDKLTNSEIDAAWNAAGLNDIFPNN